MRRLPGVTRCLLLPLALAVLSMPAGAGVMDALKKQGDKALKGDKSKPAATESGPVKSRMEDPPVTAETLDQFRKGMEVEVAEREKGKKFLASLKTPEAYRACQTELAMSPEMQKVMMSMGELPENATADQVQKHTAKVSAQMESLLVKKCGPDPGSYHPEQFVRAAVGKGQDASGLGKDDYTYHTWKEWVLEFCNYVEKLKKDKDAAQKLAKIKDEGLRIPGQGTGIYFVYSASEANLLLERCDALMPLINATI